jgi:hypothetical protein
MLGAGPAGCTESVGGSAGELLYRGMPTSAQYCSYSCGLNSSRVGTTSRAICDMLLALSPPPSCMAVSSRSAHAWRKVMAGCCLLLAASAALRGSPRMRRSIAYTISLTQRMCGAILLPLRQMLRRGRPPGHWVGSSSTRSGAMGPSSGECRDTVQSRQMVSQVESA